jgi:hypothetical protein
MARWRQVIELSIDDATVAELTSIARSRTEQSRKSSRTRCVTTLNAVTPEFKEKMAEVLFVYREVKMLKKAAEASKAEPSDAVAIISPTRRRTSRYR